MSPVCSRTKKEPGGRSTGSGGGSERQAGARPQRSHRRVAQERPTCLTRGESHCGFARLGCAVTALRAGMHRYQSN